MSFCEECHAHRCRAVSKIYFNNFSTVNRLGDPLHNYDVKIRHVDENVGRVVSNANNIYYIILHFEINIPFSSFTK